MCLCNHINTYPCTGCVLMPADCWKLHASHKCRLPERLLGLILVSFLFTHHLHCAFQETCLHDGRLSTAAVFLTPVKHRLFKSGKLTAGPQLGQLSFIYTLRNTLKSVLGFVFAFATHLVTLYIANINYVWILQCHQEVKSKCLYKLGCITRKQK